MLTFYYVHDLFCCLLPVFFLSQPCSFQQVFLAILSPVFPKVIIPFLANLQVNLELCHGYLKGVLNLLDVCHSLEIPPVFVLTQLVFH
jgi:hypothetical protein